MFTYFVVITSNFTDEFEFLAVGGKENWFLMECDAVLLDTGIQNFGCAWRMLLPSLRYLKQRSMGVIISSKILVPVY